MVGRPCKYLECLGTFNIRLRTDTIDDYRDLAQRASVKAGKQIAISDLMRPFIEAGLKELNKIEKGS